MVEYSRSSREMPLGFALLLGTASLPAQTLGPFLRILSTNEWGELSRFLPMRLGISVLLLPRIWLGVVHVKYSLPLESFQDFYLPLLLGGTPGAVIDNRPWRFCFPGRKNILKS